MPFTKFAFPLCMLVFLSCLPFHTALEWQESFRASEPSGRFGDVIAIDNDTLVVGDLRDNERSGAVFVYERGESGWIFKTKLTASDGASGDQFGGWGIDIDGDTIVVSSSFRDDDVLGQDAGAVYIFVRKDGDWIEEAILLASDGFEGQVFARNGVAIHRDTLAITSFYANDVNQGDSGAVYVFEREGSDWIEKIKLVTPRTDDVFGDGPVDWFADSLALHGDLLVVGAPGMGPYSNETGAVYLYERVDGLWTEQYLLTAPDGDSGERFGAAVAVYEGKVATSFRDDIISGSVYVWVLSGDEWLVETNVRASDQVPGDGFGRAVSLYGDVLLVGSRYPQDGRRASGAAYVFRFLPDLGGWAEEQKLVAGNVTDHNFGGKVALDHRSLAVTSSYWGEDLSRALVGTINVFERCETTDSTASLVMVSARGDTDTDLGPLEDGQEYSRKELGRSFTVRAEGFDGSASVAFSLDGNVYFVDNTAPFYMNGNRLVARRVPELAETGTYTVTATGWSGVDGTGSAGETVSVTFEIVR